MSSNFHSLDLNFARGERGDIYAEFLNAELLPNLIQDIPLFFWFQHTGAPPHSRQVREILDQQYLHRWIGRGGPRHWLN
jgi:hypothetical protein